MQPRPLITEIATQGAYGGDYVEIFGMGNYDETLDMSGWTLTDAQNEHPYVFPEGSILDYAFVLRQGIDFQFGLGAGDALYLKDTTGKVVDSFTWSRHPDGVICRNIWGNGVGAWDFEPSPFAHTGCASTALKTGFNTPATRDVRGPVTEVSDFNGDEAPTVTKLEVGASYSFQVKATGDSTLTYSATNLPPGITINASTGLVSGKPSAGGTFSPTIIVTDAHGNTAEAQRLHFDVTLDVYTTPGTHTVGGRQWRTQCDPYSQTTRCRTEIWASMYVDPATNGGYYVKSGWAFNNLTYLPSDRALWKDNPLGAYGRYAGTAEWTASDGRKWKTECDSPATGRNGCRSYAWVSVRGARGVQNMWVFNNIVKFS